MSCSLNLPEIAEVSQKEGLYNFVLDIFLVAKPKDFPLESLRSTLDNVESSLRDAESRFKEDKDLSNSIEQAREAVAKANRQTKSN